MFDFVYNRMIKFKHFKSNNYICYYLIQFVGFDNKCEHPFLTTISAS